MKKTIILAIAATLYMSATAQQVEPIKKPTEKSASDTLVITKAKYIKVGEKVFSVSELGNPGNVALIVPIQWIVESYEYLDNSSGGYSKKQVEGLQRPLAGWYQYYVDLVQQQRQQTKKKQE